MDVTRYCKNCPGDHPVVMRDGVWFHRRDWFMLCPNGITKAEPRVVPRVAKPGVMSPGQLVRQQRKEGAMR